MFECDYRTCDKRDTAKPAHSIFLTDDLAVSVRLVNQLMNFAGFIPYKADLFIHDVRVQVVPEGVTSPSGTLISLAPRPGFEPGTFRLGGGRSIRLSYQGVAASSISQRAATRKIA